MISGIICERDLYVSISHQSMEYWTQASVAGMKLVDNTDRTRFELASPILEIATTTEQVTS